MGCYDTVEVPCPICETITYAQSKSGDCGMRTYSLNNCPPDVLRDVNRHAPFKCIACGTLFEVAPNIVQVKVHRNEWKVTTEPYVIIPEEL